MLAPPTCIHSHFLHALFTHWTHTHMHANTHACTSIHTHTQTQCTNIPNHISAWWPALRCPSTGCPHPRQVALSTSSRSFCTPRPCSADRHYKQTFASSWIELNHFPSHETKHDGAPLVKGCIVVLFAEGKTVGTGLEAPMCLRPLVHLPRHKELLWLCLKIEIRTSRHTLVGRAWLSLKESFWPRAHSKIPDTVTRTPRSGEVCQQSLWRPKC